MTKRRKIFQKTFLFGIASSLFFFYGCGNPKGLTWDKDPTPTPTSNPNLASPTNFSATVQNQSQINISWDWSDSTQVETSLEFVLEYSNDNQSSWKPLETIKYPTSPSPSPFTVTHTGLSPNQTFFYRLQANNSTSSSQALIYGPITISSDTNPLPPETPPKPRATAQTDRKILIEWEWPTPGVLPVDIELYYGTSSISVTNRLVGSTCNSSSCSFTYSHEGLTPNIQYFYRIKASNSAGFKFSEIDESTTLASTYELTLELTGPGSVTFGTKTCGPASGTTTAETTGCTETFVRGKAVTLTASMLDSNSYLAPSWEGCTPDEVDMNMSCNLTMDSSKTVKVQLVSRAQICGNGYGTITLNTDRVQTCKINGSSCCEFFFDKYLDVELTATPDAGSEFMGWGNCPSSDNVCTFSSAYTRTVSSFFYP